MREAPAPGTASIPPETEPESPAMVRADLVAAMLFVILGAAILYGSWTMPRLEARRIHPMTVPGLVPGMLSAGLILCGMILGVRSLRVSAPGGWRELGKGLVSEGAMRAGVVVLLTLIYTLGLVGLLPFWAATALFVFAFVIVFEVVLGEPRRSLARSAPWAVGLAIFTAVAVTLVFERAFLVRLP